RDALGPALGAPRDEALRLVLIRAPACCNGHATPRAGERASLRETNRLTRSMSMMQPLRDCAKRAERRPSSTPGRRSFDAVTSVRARARAARARTHGMV